MRRNQIADAMAREQLQLKENEKLPPYKILEGKVIRSDLTLEGTLSRQMHYEILQRERKRLQKKLGITSILDRK